MAKLSILAPLIYIAVLVGSLAVFSSLYRKRKASRSFNLPVFVVLLTDTL